MIPTRKRASWLRWFLLPSAVLVTLAGAALAAAIVFGTAPAPHAMESVNAPMAKLDYSDMPKLLGFQARDGAALSYRAYPHDGEEVAVLIHGSSGEGSGMHALARALNGAGYAVYVPDIRGHNADGRLGDIDHAGQLDDDLTDLMRVVRREHPQAGVALIGHSSGGGFVLRVAEGPNAAMFARYILLSPAMHYGAVTWRPGSGGWATPFVPRIVALTMLDRLGLDRLGVTWFQHLPVVAFAVPDHAPVRLAPTYSFVMQQNFAAPRDDLERLAEVREPLALLAGEQDEIFYADRYAPMFASRRPDMPVRLLPGVDHMGMVTRQEALGAIVETLRNRANGPRS